MLLTHLKSVFWNIGFAQNWGAGFPQYSEPKTQVLRVQDSLTKKFKTSA